MLTQSADLTVGFVWRPTERGTLTAAVRARLHSPLGPPFPHLTERALDVPVGIEFNTYGTVTTWRLGVDVQYDSDQLREQAFHRHLYAGFAVNLPRYLLIEFLPSLDDASVLTDWEIAATVRF